MEPFLEESIGFWRVVVPSPRPDPLLERRGKEPQSQGDLGEAVFLHDCGPLFSLLKAWIEHPPGVVVKIKWAVVLGAYGEHAHPWTPFLPPAHGVRPPNTAYPSKGSSESWPAPELFCTCVFPSPIRLWPVWEQRLYLGSFSPFMSQQDAQLIEEADTWSSHSYGVLSLFQLCAITSLCISLGVFRVGWGPNMKLLTWEVSRSTFAFRFTRS